MANEITLTAELRATNGAFSEIFQPGGSFSVDQTNGKSVGGVQNIGTSAENLTTGDLTTPGYVAIKNLDDTNYVEFGVDATGFQACGKIQPGKVALFEIGNSVTLQLRANTAACDVQYVLLDR